MFEAITWSQLGIHHKACGILDIDGFYSSLIEFMNEAAHNGFIRKEHREILVYDECPELLLQKLSQWHPNTVEKWMNK